MAHFLLSTNVLVKSLKDGERFQLFKVRRPREFALSELSLNWLQLIVERSLYLEPISRQRWHTNIQRLREWVVAYGGEVLSLPPGAPEVWRRLSAMNLNWAPDEDANLVPLPDTEMHVMATAAIHAYTYITTPHDWIDRVQVEIPMSIEVL